MKRTFWSGIEDGLSASGLAATTVKIERDREFSGSVQSAWQAVGKSVRSVYASEGISPTKQKVAKNGRKFRASKSITK